MAFGGNLLLSLGIDPRGAVTGGKRAKDAIRGVGEQSKKTGREVDRLNRKMRASGKAMSMLRGGMGGMIGGLMGIATAVKAAATIGSFEESMARIKGVTMATDETMTQLTKTARELGATTSFTASQSADAILILSRAGMTASESIASVKDVLNLALVANIGMAEAADITANSLRQFGLAAAEAGRVTNVLTFVSNKTNTDITQLGEAMKMAGPIAGALGMSIEETAATIGVLSDAGIKATLAGTGLRGMLVALMDPSDKAAMALAKLTKEEKSLAGVGQGKKGLIETMKQLGVSGAVATDMVHIFNRRAAASGIILKDNASKVDMLTAAMKVMGDVASDNAKLIGNTLPHRFKALVSAIEEAILAIGDDGLGGAFKGTVNFLTQGIRAFGLMDDGITKTEKGARQLIIALGITGLTGALAALVSSLIGPVGIGLAIGLVITGLFNLGGHVDTVTEAVAKNRREIRGLTEDMTDLSLRMARAIEIGDMREQMRLLAQQTRLLKEERHIAVKAEKAGDRRGIPLSAMPRDARMPGAGFDFELVEKAINNRIQVLQDQQYAWVWKRVQSMGGTQVDDSRKFEMANKLFERTEGRSAAKERAELQRLKIWSSGAEQWGRGGKMITDEEKDKMTAQAEGLFLRQADGLKAFDQAIQKSTDKQKEIQNQLTAAQGLIPPTVLPGTATHPLTPKGIEDDVQAIKDRNQAGLDFVRGVQFETKMLDESEFKRAQLSLATEALTAAEQLGFELTEKQRAHVIHWAFKEIEMQKKKIETSKASAAALAAEKRMYENVAQSIVGPLQNALLDGDWDNIGARIVQQLSAALLGEALAQASKEFVKALMAKDGGAFSHGVQTFARGGVVEGPTAFGMRGGVGIMGEAGPEAIMPLRRGSDGRLGVESSGNGTTINDNRNITIQVRDDQGFRKTMRQLDRDTYRRMQKGTAQ